MPLPMAEATIVYDVFTPTSWPYIPASRSFRHTVFDSLHSLSHPGVQASHHLVTDQFVWPNINTDVRRWARTCTQCQRLKVQSHTNAPLSTFAAPDARFNHVHLNFVGPLLSSHRYTYLLTCIDCFPQWPCRSISGGRRYCRNSRYYIYQWVDLSFWRSFYDNNRSRTAVWVWLVVPVDETSRHQADSYYCLLSHCKRSGREFSWTAEVSSQGAARCNQLGGLSAHGIIGHRYGFEGGPSLHFIRTSVWRYLVPPWRVLWQQWQWWSWSSKRCCQVKNYHAAIATNTTTSSLPA